MDFKELKKIKEDGIYTTSQLAKKLGVTRQAVLHNIKTGTLPAIKLMGRYIIKHSDAEELIKKFG